MTGKQISFNLGPVQGFVAQARRIRDFWAGSFILAYLMAHAANRVEEKGGEILYPDVREDRTVQAIKKKGQVNTAPVIASLPNRFLAQVPNDFDPAECERAVKEAWLRVCSAVYRRFVAPVIDRSLNGAEIWRRQTENFWDISWVVGHRSLMDSRKNWRSYVPPEEPGDKCTLMENWQELSGYIRAKDREKQDAFWQQMQLTVPQLELRPGERLCSIALVKRLFPHVAEEAIGWQIPEQYKHFPSNTYLAAVHWLTWAMDTQPELCAQFAAEAAVFAKRGKPAKRFDVIAQTLNVAQPELFAFANLDGNCFFRSTLENDSLWPDSTGGQRDKLVKMLDQFKQKPSPFYALLLMDGDSMGKLLSAHSGNEGILSSALGDFATNVQSRLTEHNGICVYAGGDDVFALLPLEDALPVACELRKDYLSAFANKGLPGKATISGAIIYAHFNTPLQLVIQDAHHVLDTVAKDKTGRDSLAIRVWKRSGPVLTWSAPWEVFLAGDSNHLEQLAVAYGEADKQFTSSFFHNIRQRLKLFADLEGDIDKEKTAKILVAEYLKSRKLNKGQNQGVIRKEAEENIAGLLKLCLISWRDESGKIHQGNRLLFDGAMLVKFLATKGVEL